MLGVKVWGAPAATRAAVTLAAPEEDAHMHRRVSLWVLALAALSAVLRPVPALAADPGVRSDLLNGVARVTLDGSYAGARYTARRADGPDQPFRVLGEQNALCTGDCFAMDPDALLGATYLYTFDVTGSNGTLKSYGPYAVTIGGRAAEGLGATSSPNPLRDRGTLKITAAIPLGARAGNAARAIGLPGEVSLVDMTGRVVRRLWRGTLDRLTFDVPFVARDDRGQPLPPGLYFVVVRAGERSSISRVAIFR